MLLTLIAVLKVFQGPGKRGREAEELNGALVIRPTLDTDLKRKPGEGEWAVGATDCPLKMGWEGGVGGY